VLSSIPSTANLFFLNLLLGAELLMLIRFYAFMLVALSDPSVGNEILFFSNSETDVSLCSSSRYFILVFFSLD
jgi:hypothetical protein